MGDAWGVNTAHDKVSALAFYLLHFSIHSFHNFPAEFFGTSRTKDIILKISES